MNKKQEQYLLGNKFCLNDYKSYIEKLANSKITNEELLKEIQQSNNSINKKKKKNFKNIINQSGNCSDNSNIEKDGKKNMSTPKFGHGSYLQKRERSDKNKKFDDFNKKQIVK